MVFGLQRYTCQKDIGVICPGAQGVGREVQELSRIEHPLSQSDILEIRR